MKWRMRGWILLIVIGGCICGVFSAKKFLYVKENADGDCTEESPGSLNQCYEQFDESRHLGVRVSGDLSEAHVPQHFSSFFFEGGFEIDDSLKWYKHSGSVSKII